MALLLDPAPGRAEPWLEELKKAFPDLEVRVFPDIGEAKDIEFAAIGFTSRGKALAGCPNLRFVASIMAGVDHLVGDPDMPKDVPLVRASDPKGDRLMNETALMHVLRHHRHLHEYAVDQRAHEWKPRRPVQHCATRKVAVMGLGQIGLPLARFLAAFGFDVAGWSRSPRDVPGLTLFHGADGLAPFLARSEILVNLLPVTPETEDILDAPAFARMPKGACIVNLARGQHIVDADLIAALDSGQLAAATLDVFRTEPLPPEHPFWDHPRISIMPHVARAPHPRDLAPQVIENVRRARAGQPLAWVIDRERGY